MGPALGPACRANKLKFIIIYRILLLDLVIVNLVAPGPDGCLQPHRIDPRISG
eukprot:SAG31_NODE_3329_length_4400_cov_2.494071_6_plen_53_part_00